MVGEQDLETHRNRWVIEKRAFFEARATAAELVRNPKIDPREAVKRHPELASTYLHLRGAEEVAARRIRDPEDQRKFVSLVRSALADSVERGEPLQPVRLRERSVERPESVLAGRSVLEIETAHDKCVVTSPSSSVGCRRTDARRIRFVGARTPSYYLKVMTSRGERILWGKDLERAIAKAATGPKIGDLIGARRMSQGTGDVHRTPA